MSNISQQNLGRKKKEMRRGGSNRREEGRSHLPCLPAADGLRKEETYLTYVQLWHKAGYISYQDKTIMWLDDIGGFFIVCVWWKKEPAPNLAQSYGKK